MSNKVEMVENYINAGILVMNLKELRNFDFENKFIDLLSKIKFSVAQDQDYINVICKNRIKYLPKIWNKQRCFYGIFPNYNGKMSINIIAKKLYNIRRLRNRIFHYEKIFKYPQRTLGLYNDILEILSYLPSDNLEILKQTTTFIKTYNE